MSSAAFSNNPFFDLHANDKVLWPAVPAVLVLLILDTIGIASNMFVIYVTIKSKQLRSTANFLICLSCFFDSLHFLIHYYFAYVVLCVSLIGLNMGVALIVMTSFDRLFSVLFPQIYNQINKIIYMSFILVICAAYTAYILTISYINIQNQKDFQVVCLITEAMHGKPSTVWASSTSLLTLIAVINYCIIGICIKFKIRKSNKTQHLFKSLTIITLIMMFSWFLTSVSCVLMTVFKATENQFFYAALYIGIGINVACSANFLILYKFSTHYRKSFKLETAKWLIGPTVANTFFRSASSTPIMFFSHHWSCIFGFKK